MWALKGIWHQSSGLLRWQLSNTISWLISTFTPSHMRCQALNTSHKELDPPSPILSHIAVQPSPFSDTNNVSFFMQHLDSLLCLPTRKQRPHEHAFNNSLSIFELCGFFAALVYSGIMLVHKWSQEVSFDSDYYANYLWPKVGSRLSCVCITGVWSHSSRYQLLSRINRVNLLIAILHFSYLRKPWKAAVPAELITRQGSD